MISVFQPRLKRSVCLRAREIGALDAEEEALEIEELTDAIKKPKVRSPVLEGKDMRADASWFQWFFFSWSMSIDEISRKRRIVAKDMGALKPEELTDTCGDKLEEAYAAQPKDKKNFVYAAMSVFKKDFIVLVGMSLFKNIVDMFAPVLSRWLSEYITDKDAEIMQGIWILALLMVSEFIEQMMCEFIWFYNHVLGLKSRHSVKCMMMRKIIKQTESVQKNFGAHAAGQVMHSVGRCLNIWDMQ
jgi:hypothetical protein